MKYDLWQPCRIYRRS